MKAFLLFLVFFLIGLAILLSSQYWNPLQVNSGSTKSPMKNNFSIKNAPSDSLQGKIASMSGSVNWLSRAAQKPVKLKTLIQIQQGEEVSTGSNSTAIIRFQNFSSLLLHPDTHVSIIQLLPQNFVFEQDKGSVHYENTGRVPVSIKALDVVTFITSGFATITVDPKTQKVTVAVDHGTAKEGYEDLQNTSNVVTVTAGQTFVFDQTNKIGTVE